VGSNHWERAIKEYDLREKLNKKNSAIVLQGQENISSNPIFHTCTLLF
jgi:hypothetical protein